MPVMKPLRHPLAALAAVLFAASALASDLTGSWKTMEPGKGKRSDILDIVKFEWKDGHLTGTVAGIDRTNLKVRDADFKITNLSFKDGVVMFNLTRDVKTLASKTIIGTGGGGSVVTRDVDEESRTSRYEAKLEGDVLQGTVERAGRNGKPHKAEWSARRVK